MRFYFFASTKQINAFKNYFSFLKIENYFWKLKQKSNIFLKKNLYISFIEVDPRPHARDTTQHIQLGHSFNELEN